MTLIGRLTTELVRRNDKRCAEQNARVLLIRFTRRDSHCSMCAASSPAPDRMHDAFPRGGSAEQFRTHLKSQRAFEDGIFFLLKMGFSFCNNFRRFRSTVTSSNLRS
jgi:hypothetical protein